MIGQTISHYTILEKLGEGGMGVVYKAEDTKLKRTVALKFLPQHVAATEEEQSRFVQEAQAAAAINNPNICTIHAIEESQGHQFIVMEFVDGKTLHDVVHQSPVANLQTALAYAVQIGEALQEAHSKGIVHRDIKAENIMVNAKQQIKVMDFGLAKLKGSLKLTRTSSTVGTLAYMAPEQLQGGEVDARSDIFSYGIVLFELLTGKTPFRGEHEAAMMYSIVNEPPESLVNLRSDIPPDLERIINRALEKDPEDRYQHVDDMVSELRRIKKQTSRVSRTSLNDMTVPVLPARTQEIPAAGGGAKKKSPRLAIAGIAAAMLVLAGIGYFLFLAPAKTIDSLAVLPFVNAAGDPNTEYLSDGITESLINSLSQLSRLTVMSRSSVFHYKGKDIDPRQAGKELGVQAVLTGRVAQRGDDLLISAELVNVSDNSHIWGAQYNRNVSDLLAVQDEISKEISKNLSVKLAGGEEKKLEKHATENTEAYQYYLKGRYYWNKRTAGDCQKAVDYFDQAIEQDRNYALAYAGLASTYAIIPEYAGLPAKDYVPKSATAAKKALELDPTLAEPHAVLGLLKENFEFDWAGAEQEYQTAIRLNPKYPTTHHWYSLCLRDQGKFDDALAEIERAQELDPLSLIIAINVGETFDLMRRYDMAEDQYKKALELDPNFAGAHGDLGSLYLHEGKFDAAVHEFQKMRELVGNNGLYGLGALGYAYARAGRKEDAGKILQQCLDESEKGYIVSLQLALIYTGLRNYDKAFLWLEKAYEDRIVGIGSLKTLQQWEPLRSDPRYHEMLKKINLDK